MRLDNHTLGDTTRHASLPLLAALLAVFSFAAPALAGDPATVTFDVTVNATADVGDGFAANPPQNPPSSVLYTFVTTPGNGYEVETGGSASATAANLCAAITANSGTDGFDCVDVTGATITLATPTCLLEWDGIPLTVNADTAVSFEIDPTNPTDYCVYTPPADPPASGGDPTVSSTEANQLAGAVIALVKAFWFENTLTAVGMTLLILLALAFGIIRWFARR